MRSASRSVVTSAMRLSSAASMASLPILAGSDESSSGEDVLSSRAEHVVHKCLATGWVTTFGGGNRVVGDRVELLRNAGFLDVWFDRGGDVGQVADPSIGFAKLHFGDELAHVVFPRHDVLLDVLAET